MQIVHSSNGPSAEISESGKEFNRLSLKIEKLKDKIEAKTAEMDHCNTLWSKYGHEVFRKTVDYRFMFVKMLFSFYRSEKVTSKNKQEILKDLTLMQLNMISHFQQIYVPVGFEEFRKTVMMNKAFQPDESSIEYASQIVIKELGIKNADPEKIKEWMRNGASLNELFEKLSQQILEQGAEKEPKTNRKQNKKPSLKTKIQETINTNISELYRQLAKVFHPDLEIDSEKKKAKEILMTELNIAYDSKNIHRMLELEMNWISSAAERLQNLPDEKMKIYIQSLKEQVKVLQKELKEVPAHPKYNIIQQVSQMGFCESLEQYFEIINQYAIEQNELEFSVDRLAGKDALKYLNQLISDFKSYLQAEAGWGFEI